MDMGGFALTGGPEARKKRVCYFYDPDVGNYYYGQGHPMKPQRIRMTHSLLSHYNILNRMEVLRPHPARDKDLCQFHADDYVNFLKEVTPESQYDYHARQLKRFNVGEDCPVFDGLYNFCQTSAGGSVGGARKLNQGNCDIAINWAGGLHHAKKCEASGFCYVNDIVLAILELLITFQVLKSLLSSSRFLRGFADISLSPICKSTTAFFCLYLLSLVRFRVINESKGSDSS